MCMVYKGIMHYISFYLLGFTIIYNNVYNT